MLLVAAQWHECTVGCGWRRRGMQSLENLVAMRCLAAKARDAVLLAAAMLRSFALVVAVAATD